MAKRRKLDDELVRRGLADSPEDARELVNSGLVLVSVAVAFKRARMVRPGEPVRVAGQTSRFVSRGGQKLDAALSHFGIEATGMWCIDVGASTGGFTDCLLQRGSAKVAAIDVGKGLLHERIASSPNVEVFEGVNARHLNPEDVGGPADLVCADVSFISLKTLMRVLASLTQQGGELILLIKPQFEASRLEADRGGGVIRSPSTWESVITEVALSAVSEGLHPSGVMASPIKGAQGNVEFFLHALRGFAKETPYDALDESPEGETGETGETGASSASSEPALAQPQRPSLSPALLEAIQLAAYSAAEEA